MKIENGIHTFSLTRQCTYSGIQNIIAANRAVPDKEGGVFSVSELSYSDLQTHRRGDSIASVDRKSVV